MYKPVFRVVGLDHATCDADYCGTETRTNSVSIDTFSAKLYSPPADFVETVTVRIKDIMPALQKSNENRLNWIQDIADDPVVITRDLYEVLLTYQRLRNAA